MFRKKDADSVEQSGYTSQYYADIVFSKKVDTAGFIHVTIPPKVKTKPHAHALLQEVFIALSPLKVIVDSNEYSLGVNDLIMVDSNEYHSIENPLNQEANVIAVKFPNLKEDKVQNSN